MHVLLCLGSCPGKITLVEIRPPVPLLKWRLSENCVKIKDVRLFFMMKNLRENLCENLSENLSENFREKFRENFVRFFSSGF